MPIGGYEDFADLKAHLRASYARKRRKPGDLDAITATVAEKIRPGWHREAARVRKERERDGA